jgi:hypothetical protein
MVKYDHQSEEEKGCCAQALGDKLFRLLGSLPDRPRERLISWLAQYPHSIFRARLLSSTHKYINAW